MSSEPSDVFETSSSVPSPTVTIAAPIHSFRLIRRCSITRPSGSAKTIVVMRSGWTITIRPIPSAIACATKPSPCAARPMSHTGCRASRIRNPPPTDSDGTVEAAFSCSTSPSANRNAATSARTMSTRGA